MSKSTKLLSTDDTKFDRGGELHKMDRFQVTDPNSSLDRADPAAVQRFIQTAHSVDLAAYFDELQPDVARQQLLALPLTRRVEVFGYLRPEVQVALARLFERSQLAEIITEMSADDRADFFNDLSLEEQQALLRGLAQTERDDIRRLAAYAEGTAGAIMTSDYAALTPELTSQDAIEVLRREAPDTETIYRAYVVDPDRCLIGSVRLQDLILASTDAKVADLMERDPVAVTLHEDQEDVARKFAHYDVLALPVVDVDGRLVGIVTHDDALDALQEETTEDFHKIGTVGKLTQGVRDASIGILYRKRVLWLGLLIFGNLFSGAGIAYFEHVIVSYVSLVFFLPLLIGSSGNAGSQAATLMVRALATGDVMLKDWGYLLGRELLVAVALGATMALAIAPIGLARGGPAIALVVALTMLLVVLAGSVIGMSLPFLLSRFRLDPAAASAPLVTTIADAIGVILYFSIASAFLIT
ncbi:MAG: magnesium transporter [Pseudomonadales bacterium]|nr:magnesium transporter [Pseudomonadales bacterium]